MLAQGWETVLYIYISSVFAVSCLFFVPIKTQTKPCKKWVDLGANNKNKTWKNSAMKGE